jgi:hypothetical protein
LPLFLLFLAFSALPMAVRADAPWKAEREQVVALRQFPESVRGDAPRSDTLRVRVEELETSADGYQLRFFLEEGHDARGRILAYLDATVRPGRGGPTITLDMMQSFGNAGGGTMSTLCRAVALHADFRAARAVEGLLDYTNDRAIRAAMADSGATAESAFRAVRPGRDRRLHAVVPAAKHLSLLLGGSYELESLTEVPAGGSRRFRFRVSRSEGGALERNPADCPALLEAVR